MSPNFVLRDRRGVTLDTRRTVSDYEIGNGDTLYIESKGQFLILIL